jgi:deoxyribonuclease-1-like protein
MGSKWDYSISDPTQSPSAYISERYAFLWKTSKVTLKGKPFLDIALANVINREPYIANFLFKGNNTPITIINFHSKKHDDHPEEEIKHFINYNQRLTTDNILLCGDFNLDETHPVWLPFYAKGYKNAIANTPTTLKMKCKNGGYRNHSIDNIYAQGDFDIVEAGAIDFVKDCDKVIAARQLSDHLPVYIQFEIK